jgi:hypothetical protein
MAALLILASCGDEKSTPSNPQDDGVERLAGGGRSTGDDPFNGGPEGSGPSNPGFDYPDPGYLPLFYSDIDCAQEPSRLVIRNQDDWQAWWTDAIACLDPGAGRDRLPLRGSLRERARYAVAMLDDSVIVEPDSTFPYPPDAPIVDFEENVIVAVRLEADTLIGRGVWVTDVVESQTGSEVTLEITQPGDDCFVRSDPPGSSYMASPTLACLIPGRLPEPVTWHTVEVIFDCSWEPDPNLPVALYYTDADCDLGPGEVVLRSGEAFEAWLEVALRCDQARWIGRDSTVTPGGGGGEPGARWGGGGKDSIEVPVDPPPPPPDWIGIDVDFTTHAVLILRAGPQTRWGGGVWLDKFEPAESGTLIQYTVMEPGIDCPEVEGDAPVNPTVAIRVPLPVPEPITWARETDSIGCQWEPVPGEKPPGR